MASIEEELITIIAEMEAVKMKIDELRRRVSGSNAPEGDNPGQPLLDARCLSIASTNIEQAQLWFANSASCREYYTCSACSRSRS